MRLVNAPASGRSRQKTKMFTRRQRHTARLRAKADDKADRLEAKANARVFGKRYAVFFGCDPDRTEALADAERFRRDFMAALADVDARHDNPAFQYVTQEVFDA